MKLVEENLPPNINLKDVDIWFQDETRVGQQSSITSVWAEKGSRPFATRQQNLIIISKPPALPEDSQSLTYTGI